MDTMDETLKQIREDEEAFDLIREHLRQMKGRATDEELDELDEVGREVDWRKALSIIIKIAAGVLLLGMATRGIIPAFPATLLFAHEIWSAWERGRLA